MLLVGLEPEEESPILFLRLRKAVRKHRTAVTAIAPFATRGLTKLSRHPRCPPPRAPRPRSCARMVDRCATDSACTPPADALAVRQGRS